MLEKFCSCQTKCDEDTDDTWTCTAHMAEARVYQCPFKSYTESQVGKYPCVDARMDREEFRPDKKVQGECDRCKIRMSHICASDGYGNRIIYWCTMCGAIQIIIRRPREDFDGIEFRYPEMTADLPCNNE